MRLLGFVALLGLAVSCNSDNGVNGLNVIGVTPNPPDLSPPVQVDRIVQTTVPSVDVLWVIDDSCSMQEEQAALTENFPKFMNFFKDSGLDYHVGVVSTDMEEWNKRGKLQADPNTGIKIIDPDVSDPISVFERMASLGTDGSADEMGRAAVWNALVARAYTDNAGFFRDDAFLSVIVISDENDSSGDSPVSLPDFKNWLLNVKQTPDMVSFSSIVGPPGGCVDSYDPGLEYLEVTQAVGGIEWSICDSNWDQALEELGMAAAGLRREFFLSEIPVEGTLNVWIMDSTGKTDLYIDTDFSYTRQRNSVLFSNMVPEPLSEIFISYEVLAGQAGTTAAVDTATP